MNRRDSLTYDNFWTKVTEQHPDAVKAFGEWIDEYKKDINWPAVFEQGHDMKFHDLPIGMQFGIFLEYAAEKGGCYMDVEIFNTPPEDIMAEYFAVFQAIFNDEKD